MRFPTRLTYALRMMVEISKKSEKDVPVPVPEIARITGTSKNYLEQLAMILKSQTLLEGVSGRKGGYRLARRAEEIEVFDVVKATMGPIELTRCVSHPESCVRSDTCESRRLWCLINLHIDSVLRRYSLADLTDEKRLDSMSREIEQLRTGDEARVARDPAGEFPCTEPALGTRGTGEAWAGHVAPSGRSLPDDRTPNDDASSKDVRKDDYMEVLAWLEEELQLRVGDMNVSIPVNRQGAKVVYTTNLREVKYMPFSLLAAAEIFYAAREDWTMVTAGWDGNDLFERFLEREAAESVDSEVFSSARKLNAEKVVLSECGHVVSPPRWGGPTQSIALETAFPVESFIHTMLNYVRDERILLDPSRNAEPVTYHDPCLFGRYYGVTE
jgi:Rrf2 family protein